MTDLLMVGLTVLFFGICLAYVLGCEREMPIDPHRKESQR